jgi:2,4-dienoyl-CoA reductase-like NADH-dependent reductase (Old Yellow Enzyme family)
MSTTISQSLQLPIGQRLANRIAKSAMSERIATPDGAPTLGHVRLYESWARGGAGLLISGNVMIDSRALGESGNVVVEDERHLDALRVWATASKGTRTWLQINHPGRQSPRSLSREPVAPSAIKLVGAGPMFAKPRALEDREIREIIERFARTASIVESAGFDGVQIHAAHGYLISQFLSPYTNRRTDEWGGDADRRRHLLIETVRAVRAAVRPGFAVGVKLNSADFQRGGFDETESMRVLEALDAENIDLLEISGGTYEASVMFDEPKRASTQAREAFFLDYAEKARARVRMPVMLTGGFRTRDGMDAALASGAVDVIGMARPFALEPDLAARLLSGEATAARSVRISTGIKSLDALIQGGWYQAQLDRMAHGRAPDPGVTRFWALVRYFMPRNPPRWDRTLPAAVPA